MNQTQQFHAELERQELIKQCHRLISAIAYRPGYIKLLTLAKNHLETLAQYKGNCQRSRRFSQ
jgi:hypothetical protein